MDWARDARNTIEKEGDLEMQSTLHVALLFSYLSNEDMVLEVDRRELLQAGVDQLLRRAVKELPAGIADAALLKIQRRWVVNSLPGVELIYALTYTYSRLHEACTSLAKHLGITLDSSVLHPTSFDPTTNDFAKVRYTKLSDSSRFRQAALNVKRDPEFRPPPAMVKIKDELDVMPTTMAGVIELHGKLAEANFNHCKNHMPMVFFYSDKWVQIDAIFAVFNDQSEKFIFWRTMADRAFYLKAHGFVFVTETWVRELLDVHVPVRQMPITGELLQVICGDVSGVVDGVVWKISRDAENIPSLHLRERFDSDAGTYSFIEPLLGAMRLSNTSGVKVAP